MPSTSTRRHSTRPRAFRWQPLPRYRLLRQAHPPRLPRSPRHRHPHRCRSPRPPRPHRPIRRRPNPLRQQPQHRVFDMGKLAYWMPQLAFGALLAVGLACGPFPSPAEPTAVGSVIPGTRSLTDDRAFYESPAWSPDGRYLTVGRGYQIFGDIIYADSLETGPVLIDLDSGERRIIGSPPTVKPEDAVGPFLWQPGDAGVTFYYFDRAGGQEAPTLVTYSPDTGGFSSPLNFCRCGRVAFNAEGNQILVVGPSEEAFELSWIDLETGQTTDELSLDRAEPRQHRYFYAALSPDNRSLLLDDLDGTVFRYEMDTGQAPLPFLSSAATPAWSPHGSNFVYASLPASG